VIEEEQINEGMIGRIKAKDWRKLEDKRKGFWNQEDERKSITTSM